MAKYTITHTCGHTETVNLQGPTAERERRIAAMESTPCAECRAKEGEGMTGSVKQIAWAVDIRKGMINTVKRTIERQIAENAPGLTDEQLEQVRAGLNETIDKINGIDNARWFIDHRTLKDADAVTIIQTIQAM